LLRMIGLNVVNVDADQIKMSLYYIDRERSKLISTINKIARDQSLTPPERRRRIQNFRQKISEYDEMQMVLTNAGGITRNVIKRLNERERTGG